MKLRALMSRPARTCAAALLAIAALPARARFHWLTARRSSIIQVSPVHTGRTGDPDGLCERLLARMVLPPTAPAGA